MRSGVMARAVPTQPPRTFSMPPSAPVTIAIAIAAGAPRRGGSNNGRERKTDTARLGGSVTVLKSQHIGALDGPTCGPSAASGTRGGSKNAARHRG
eukprot:13470844-Heterocapsa_arctica.AAC.1